MIQDIIKRKWLKLQRGDRCNITKDFREYIGREYTTNEGYKITILDYIGRHEILIKFNDNPDDTIWTTLQNIKNGQIKNPYKRSVYNIGYYGVGNYTARNNNIKTEEYIKWISMFVRCYDDKYHERQPSYIGCTVAEPFQNFQIFAEWYNHNIYECNYPLELDKDFLYEGNKIYSPATCCFLPKEINTAINYKRHDVEYMQKLYLKYKMELPYRLRMELYYVSHPKEIKKAS